MGAVARTSGTARVARPATAIDFTDDPLPLECPAQGDPDELVAEHAAERLVASNQLKVGLADPCLEHLHHRLAVLRQRIRSISLEPDAIGVEDERAHFPREPTT
jgi:hypothetical protein